jgi:hypothetical protein
MKAVLTALCFTLAALGAAEGPLHPSLDGKVLTGTKAGLGPKAMPAA